MNRSGVVGLVLVGCWLSSGYFSSISLSVADEPPVEARSPATTTVQPLDELLRQIRDEYKLPALGAAILTPAGLQESAVVGLRKTGDATRATVDDLWHLGSCTKAMTATLLGTLVQEQKLQWETTLVALFPDLASQSSEDFRQITLAQLLTHRSGLPANGAWRQLGDQLSTTDQRRELLRDMVQRDVDHPPGTKYVYSNVGYALAGLMAEQVTAQSWEQLMRERLFQPLHMEAVGFGVAGTVGQVDQPWGHHSTWLGFGPLNPVQLDNAAALGPAGTVHASLESWSRFLVPHLTSDPAFLPLEIWQTLHAPIGEEEYAMGWIVPERAWAAGEAGKAGEAHEGRALTHSGSNTVNYCVCWLAPERQFGIIACTNSGQTNAPRALDKLVSLIILDRYAPASH